jgi:small-conductance mechanosensitive channel
MKLLDQVWRANDAYDWAVALAIVLGVLLALVVVRFWAWRLIRRLAARTTTRADDIAAGVVAATRLWLLAPVAFYAGALALDLPARIDRLFAAIAVVGGTVQVAFWMNCLIQGLLERRIARLRSTDAESVTVLSLLAFAGRVLIWTVLLLVALDQVGFNITALVAGLGVGGVAVALAVQSILGDLFASLSIVLDKPFVVGDFIVVDGLRGTVERVGIKTTRVRSLDGELLVFSNADLLKSRIRNFKRMLERRVEFTIALTYETPPDKLRRVPQWLREAVKTQQRTRFDRAHFKQFGESAMVFEVVYYVLDSDYNVYMDVHQAISFAIGERLARERVDFAYPTRTLRVHAVPAEAQEGGRTRDAAA